ncbi:MAG: phosphotransferase [Anaerolineaceae bacterium]|nr:phosphotransferase [Anaerolineaceae bacterium]
MKAWDETTRRGRILRVRALGVKALQYYDLDISHVRLIGAYTNLALRADCKDGRSYLVRVGFPGWRTDGDIESEMIWLDALADTDIGAPHPVRSKEGQWQVYETMRGVPEARRVVVQSWLKGRSMEDDGRLTPVNLFKMGVLFAKMHQFSAEFQPPVNFTDRRMDHYLARDEEAKLFSEANLGEFPEGTLDTFQRVNEKVLTAFSSLYEEETGLRVIHNDLWHGNIKIYRGHLYPLDFEDTILGYPVQDIAMAMQDLMENVETKSYEPLLAQFRAGYESLLPWPERYVGEMDSFRAGRMLWVANYVACHQGTFFSSYVKRTTPMFETYMRTGELCGIDVKG